MKKSLLIGSLLMIIFLINGCAISDYITGIEENKSYSLLEEKEILEEIEEDLEENEEEIEEGLEEMEERIEDEEDLDEEKPKKAPIEISVKENEEVNLKPKAQDADEDNIIYTFSEPLDENGRWQTNYGDAGEYLITVTASDGKLETSRKVLLIVERVNVAPKITDVPDNIEVEEGDILVLTPVAEDPNGDDVELSISEPVGEDGEWALGYQDAGDYTVEITATDGELESVKKVLISVKKKNVAPVIENLEEEITVDEGEEIILSPVVTDLNKDEIKLTIAEPVGNDGIWETGYTDHGEYIITVEADDGTTTTTEEVKITVNDVNVAPVIDDIVLG
ncbi:hypothetical protein GF361_04295 [Candidatus Woesearchaeota archaeon]|nr:hypothetical protein [Candidatus Woesearchaeota archaeon]